MSIAKAFKKYLRKTQEEVLIKPPKVVETEWRPHAGPVLETPRDRFLRERAHRRKAINRTKNKLAHAARRENW